MGCLFAPKPLYRLQVHSSALWWGGGGGAGGQFADQTLSCVGLPWAAGPHGALGRSAVSRRASPLVGYGRVDARGLFARRCRRRDTLTGYSSEGGAGGANGRPRQSRHTQSRQWHEPVNVEEATGERWAKRNV